MQDKYLILIDALFMYFACVLMLNVIKALYLIIFVVIKYSSGNWTFKIMPKTWNYDIDEE